jgi:hypothetical protein
MRLRKEFKKKVVLPYQKRKTNLNLNILEKVYKIKKRYLIFSLLFLIFFLFNKKYLLFFILTIGSAVFSFYHSKINRTPLDFKMALFLGLFITKYYGILYTLIFFVISDTVPALLGGESIKGPDLLFYSWYFIVNAMIYFFPSVPLTTLGPIVVIVEATGSFFINTFFGYPSFMSLFISILAVLVRIIYFLTLGRVLEFLF